MYLSKILITSFTENAQTKMPRNVSKCSRMPKKSKKSKVPKKSKKSKMPKNDRFVDFLAVFECFLKYEYPHSATMKKLTPQQLVQKTNETILNLNFFP